MNNLQKFLVLVFFAVFTVAVFTVGIFAIAIAALALPILAIFGSKKPLPQASQKPKDLNNTIDAEFTRVEEKKLE